MTVAMPFLQKLITFLWPPDIRPGLVFYRLYQMSILSWASVWPGFR